MSGKIRKEFRLPKDAIAILEKTKAEFGYSTDTETLVHILNEFDNKKDITISEEDKQMIAEMVVQEFKGAYKKQFDRIRLASTFAERYSYMILDAINTMLYETKATFLMPANGETQHQVIRESNANLKEILERNKQIRDNNALKGGNE